MADTSLRCVPLSGACSYHGCLSVHVLPAVAGGEEHGFISFFIEWSQHAAHCRGQGEGGGGQSGGGNLGPAPRQDLCALGAAVPLPLLNQPLRVHAARDLLLRSQQAAAQLCASAWSCLPSDAASWKVSMVRGKPLWLMCLLSCPALLCHPCSALLAHRSW